MRHLIILTAVAALLSGCTAHCWTKPGLTQPEWIQDRYACERDMRQSGYYGAGIMGAIEAGQFFNRCLEAHGYYSTTNCGN